jgi:hypothetical protein
MPPGTSALLRHVDFGTLVEFMGGFVDLFDALVTVTC